MPADAYRSPGPRTGPDGLGGESKSRFPSWPGSVQMTCEGTIVRTQPIRHDRAKEHGAFATPRGRPRKQRQDAPDRAGVKATPLRAAAPGPGPPPRSAAPKAHSRDRPRESTTPEMQLPELISSNGYRNLTLRTGGIPVHA